MVLLPNLGGTEVWAIVCFTLPCSPTTDWEGRQTADGGRFPAKVTHVGASGYAEWTERSSVFKCSLLLSTSTSEVPEFDLCISTFVCTGSSLCKFPSLDSRSLPSSGKPKIGNSLSISCFLISETFRTVSEPLATAPVLRTQSLLEVSFSLSGL